LIRSDPCGQLFLVVGSKEGPWCSTLLSRRGSREEDQESQNEDAVRESHGTSLDREEDVSGLLASEQTLDFLQTCDTQGAGENSFFLEAEMIPCFRKPAKLIRLACKTADSLTHGVIDG